uniref:CCHC-type domain-containing protein n=1 Tax=Setaria italica TaxID=4555 RepID=K3XPU8_SETIT
IDERDHVQNGLVNSVDGLLALGPGSAATLVAGYHGRFVVQYDSVTPSTPPRRLRVMGSPSPGSASPPLPQLAASAAQGLVASTSTLNPNAPPFHGFPASARSGGMLRFSDSEASSGSGESEPPSPTGRGKAVLPLRRHRRRRRLRQNPEGFMPAARRAHLAPAAAPAPTRLASLVVHPARMSAAPDAEGFGQVESRRRWRRAAPSRPSKPVPPELVGLCFNCPASDYVRANRSFPARCLTCKQEGHRARDCTQPARRAEAKRGRSPARLLESRRGVAPGRRPARHYRCRPTAFIAQRACGRSSDGASRYSPHAGASSGGGRLVKRTSRASAGSFKFRVLVGLKGIPAHARCVETAQLVLGSSCAKVEPAPNTAAGVDEDYCNPRAEEEIIKSHLPALRYLVRLRIVEFQDWHTPLPSSDDGYDGRGGDSDDSGDSNFNGYWPGFSEGRGRWRLVEISH